MFAAYANKSGLACGDETVHDILYADDSALVFLSAEGLQKLLDITSLFCDAYGMKVNTLKTDIVVFSLHAVPTTTSGNIRAYRSESLNLWFTLGILFSLLAYISRGMVDSRSQVLRRSSL